MAITLGGVALSDHLQWVDRYTDNRVAQTTKRTLAGNLVVFSHGLNKGREISLVATETTGWFTKAMVDAIQTLSESVGSSYSLDFHGEILNVMFYHAKPPAVTFTPLQYKEPQTSVDYFIGRINLISV